MALVCDVHKCCDMMMQIIFCQGVSKEDVNLMWTVIYIAPSSKIAERIQQRLTDEGFLVKVREARVSKQYEILVPEGEVHEVQEVLSTILH